MPAARTDGEIRAPRPADAITGLAIAATAAAAWAILIVWEHAGSSLPAYVAAWTAMMVAMMLPSAAPFVLLYRRGASGGATTRLASGYLAVWAATGVVVWALHEAAMAVPAAAVLAVAGVYQLTPAKQACLRRCRSAADFLVQYWRSNAFVLGAHHGWYCLGCCWALMAVLVVAGMMSLTWVVAVTVLVAVEKLLPRGEVVARLTGVGLLALAVLELTTTVEVTTWM